MLTISDADVFRQTRQWLIDNRQSWIQRNFYSLHDDGRHQHCLVGALAHTLGACESLTGSGGIVYDMHREELVKTIRLGDFQRETPERLNDYVGYDAIMRLLDETIDRLEAVQEAQHVLAEPERELVPA